MSVSLKLTKEEALVLFELLSRWESDGKLDTSLFAHASEAKVLSVALLGQLEITLTEPFDKNYDVILKEYRQAVLNSSLGARRE
jgi:hypothetical protein